MSNYIRKVKYNNHPSLGNLELDFCKNDNPCNTVVFAGENGCGKTTILSTLFFFLDKGTFEDFKYISYNIDDIVFELFKINPSDAGGWHRRKNVYTSKIRDIQTSKNFNGELIDKDGEDVRHYGCVYSRSRSGFTTKYIKSTSTLDIDRNKYDTDRDDDFTGIKQLLVDIDRLDSKDWKLYCEKNKGPHDIAVEFESSSRVCRFKQAFNKFFGGKMEYVGVEVKDGNELEICFMKNGRKVFLDDLSTGEKQIVFRGAMLLRNRDKLDGGFVFVDEPELSMHPKWQKKILNFYRDLFTRNGKQIVQMFFATHSEYVLSSALEDKDNILILSLQEDEQGMIAAEKMTLPVYLSSIRSSEINYRIFGIPTKEYHNDLYGRLQSLCRLVKVKEMDDWIAQNQKYNQSVHAKQYVNISHSQPVTYKTLPTYIRNCIDHPDHRGFTSKELSDSIELLGQLCADVTLGASTQNAPGTPQT